MGSEGLLATLQQDMKTAMRAKDKLRLSTLRMLLAKIKYVMIESKEETMSDDDVKKQIMSKLKQHKDSVEQFRNGGREDLAEKELAEIEILQAYLPQQITGDTLAELIGTAIAETGAESKRDMGKVMKFLSANYMGQYDGKEASGLVNQLLS